MGTFGQRLKELRNSRGISQNELSKHIGVSKSSVNMYERDEREPGFETLEAIADFFNVNMDYLLGREYHISTLEDSPLTSRLYEIADEYRRTRDQDKLVDDILELEGQAKVSLFSFAIEVLLAVEQGRAIVVDDDGKPIQPRTGGPQDTPVSPVGKGEDTTTAADSTETPPEGEKE